MRSLVIALCTLVHVPAAAAAPWHFTLAGRLAGVAERGDDSLAVPRGEAGVGGEVWQDGIRCQSVAAGASASLVAGDEPAQLTGAQWASVCISARTDEGLDIVLLDLQHSLEWDQRPALSMPRSLWQRRYRREQIGLTWAAVDFLAKPASTLHFVALNMRPRFDFVSQDDDAGRATQTTWGIDVMVLGFYDEKPDRVEAANFLVLEVDGIFDALSTTVLTFVPAEARGMVLGNHLAMVDGRVFFQNGQQYLHPEGEEVVNVQNRSLYGADIEVYRRGEWLSGGLRLARELYPTFDEELAVDTRAAGWVSAQRAPMQATLRGFVAHTAVSAPLLPGTEPGQPEATETSDVTGGVALDLRVDVGRWLALGLGVEVARSYYARLDGDRVPTAALGAQALVNAIVRVGHASHPASPLW